MSKVKVTVVGGGLAGSEAALVLSKNPNIEITLYEMRPEKNTEVHKTGDFAELVCSNSFKSMKETSAAGMLKYELELLNSPVYKCALNNRVEAGNALAVDRDLFSQEVTKLINDATNIKVVKNEFIDIESESKNCDYLILATGPLTSDNLAKNLLKLTGEDALAFYDAAAPIVMADSLDRSIIFEQDRYADEGAASYLNIPMDKQEYETFINELLNAEYIIKKDFESKDLFQACQPIEEVARSGFDAPRYGAMKPVGLTDPRNGKRPYAVVQLRAENKEKTSYNLVGFQTNLTFAEQKRIFSMLPGLEKAEFVRFGVMHRNTFINAPKLLSENLNLKDNIYVAGQLCGTEGYLEAVRSGYHAAVSVLCESLGEAVPSLSDLTAFGSLIKYATNPETKNYQPMHVNFGIFPPLENQIRNKRDRYDAFAKRGKIEIENYAKELQSLWKKI